MTHLDFKLYDWLANYGNPTNVFVFETMLSFDLKNPKFGENAQGVFNFQQELMELFPEYTNIIKLNNNKDHFFIVLKK